MTTETKTNEAGLSHDVFGCYANIWIRQKVFSKAGDISKGHKHMYDHVSLLAQGKVEVTVDGVVREFEGPRFLVIRKDRVHSIKALSDDVAWFCLFANRDVTGEVYDPEFSDPMYHNPDSAEQNLSEEVPGIDLFTLNPDGSVQS